MALTFVTTDAAGNVYTGGYINATFDGESITGGDDIFLKKIK